MTFFPNLSSSNHYATLSSCSDLFWVDSGIGTERFLSLKHHQVSMWSQAQRMDGGLGREERGRRCNYENMVPWLAHFSAACKPLPRDG